MIPFPKLPATYEEVAGIPLRPHGGVLLHNRAALVYS